MHIHTLWVFGNSFSNVIVTHSMPHQLNWSNDIFIAGKSFHRDFISTQNTIESEMRRQTRKMEATTTTNEAHGPHSYAQNEKRRKELLESAVWFVIQCALEMMETMIFIALNDAKARSWNNVAMHVKIVTYTAANATDFFPISIEPSSFLSIH